MRPGVVVRLQEGVEVGLHLVDGLVKLLAAHNPEVFVCARGAVLDAFQLQEQLVRVPVLAASEIASVIAENCRDLGAVLLEERQHVVVHDVHRRHRQLRGVEPAPDVAAVAVDNALQIDLADALQVPDEEGIHGHQVACEISLDVAFPELGREPFQEPHLISPPTKGGTSPGKAVH